jgi:hypothetical protein
MNYVAAKAEMVIRQSRWVHILEKKSFVALLKKISKEKRKNE